MKIAFLDTGINPHHSEFVGRIDPASRDIVANRELDGDPWYFHGTKVAGVAAAARNGSSVQGLAFEATILMLKINDTCDGIGSNGNPKCGGAPYTGGAAPDRYLAQAIQVAVDEGARVINVSMVVAGDDIDALRPALDAAAAAGIVLVIAAGNNANHEPDLQSVSFASAMGRGLVIIAGSVDANGMISPFSNRAGPAAEYYLAALGEGVELVSFEDKPGAGANGNGTSYAAPVVSGAVALLAHAFPNLTGAEIVEILFTTADDAGAPGVDPVYGRGILNLARAFQPIGATAMAGSMLPVSTVDNGEGSEAMGDAAGSAANGVAGAVILDRYNRAFVLDLARTIARAEKRQPLGEALQAGLSTGQGTVGGTSLSMTVKRDLTRTAQTGFAREEANHGSLPEQTRLVSGHTITRLSPNTAVAFGFAETGRTLSKRLSGADGAAFLIARDPIDRAGFSAGSDYSIGVRHDFGLAALTVTGEMGKLWRPTARTARGAPLDTPSYTSATIKADRRIGGVHFGVGVTRLAEEETVLGGQFAFAPAGSESWFADASASASFGHGWNAAASYRRGWTMMPGGNGLVESGEMATSAWALDVAKNNALTRNDRLSFRVMQPLRVAGGGYRMHLPVSYDYSDLGVGYESRLFSLAPSGRELDFEAAWGVGLLDGSARLTANGFYRLDPGHIANSRDDIGGAIRFSLGF